MCKRSYLDLTLPRTSLIWLYFTKIVVFARHLPKEDITAYELAQMMPIFHGQHYFDEEWEALPWKRHWRRTDKT